MQNWNSTKTQSENKSKTLFFLVAMPRSGNTLFSSIMNQNPDVCCTANSITLEIMKDLFLLKKTDVFQNYPDHQSLDNVLDSVYNTYYKNWHYKYIIDRGPVMTKGNLRLIQKHFKKPFKCVVLLRDLMDILASYMKWYTENPDAFPNRHDCKNDDEKLSMAMSKDGAIAKDLEAIRNSFNYKDMCYFMKYDDFVNDPEKHIKEIYQFLNIPYFQHHYSNLQQLVVNGISYNEEIVGKNMHTIRAEIKKEYNPYIEKIPQRIREKYGHIKF